MKGLLVILLAVLTVALAKDPWVYFPWARSRYTQCDKRWRAKELYTEDGKTICTDGSVITSLSLAMVDAGQFSFEAGKGKPAEPTPLIINHWVKNRLSKEQRKNPMTVMKYVLTQWCSYQRKFIPAPLNNTEPFLNPYHRCKQKVVRAGPAGEFTNDYLKETYINRDNPSHVIFGQLKSDGRWVRVYGFYDKNYNRAKGTMTTWIAGKTVARKEYLMAVDNFKEGTKKNVFSFASDFSNFVIADLEGARGSQWPMIIGRSSLSTRTMKWEIEAENDAYREKLEEEEAADAARRYL